MKNIDCFFRNKIVVITGASSGIGKALSIELSTYGAILVLAARNDVKLAETAELCLMNTNNIKTVQTDVSDKSSCEILIKETINEYDRIDILINNAGITMSTSFLEANSLDLIENNIKVNFLGSVYCTYFALPYLKQTNGIIAGIGSLSSKWGFPTKSGYVASKHAMSGFFDSLRMELINDNVHITMIHPSFVATGTRHSGKGIMDVTKCANIIITSIYKRRREVIFTLPGKVALWIKIIAPKILDTINIRMMRNTNLLKR